MNIRLSILVAMYNEANSIQTILERVAEAPASYFQQAGICPQLIVVDNGSRDNSHAIVEAFAHAHPEVSLQLLRLPENKGKGAGIQTALAQAQSDFSIIQDADLEYDPADYPALLQPLIAGEADVVLGSRFLVGDSYRPLAFWQARVNRFISGIAGLVTSVDLSDVETGFKAFRTSLAQSVPLESDTFGIDPELVIQFAKRRARFVEVPIHFRGRTPEQGKKIRAADTFDAIATIFRARFFTPPYKDPGSRILATMLRARRFNGWMADTISPFINGDVLELGAGIGNLTMLLATGAHRYLATDTNPEPLFELRSRLKYRPDIEVEPFDFSNAKEAERFHQSADTVVCLNVLEHLEDDHTALTNICNCLRPGGRAIVLVPQGPELFGRLDEVLQHKRRYRKDELAEKMQAAGFRLEQIIEFNRATRPGWFLNSRILRRSTISLLQLKAFDLFVPLWKRIDRSLPWPSNSLIAIGAVDN